jgi:hypothetical protein
MDEYESLSHTKWDCKYQEAGSRGYPFGAVEPVAVSCRL